MTTHHNTHGVLLKLVRLSGWLTIVGAIVGAIIALVVAFALPEASEEWYVGSQIAVVLHPLIVLNHLIFILAVLGVFASGAAGSSALARWGTGVSLLGLVTLTGCEIWFMTNFGNAYPSPASEPLNVSYGISSIVTGVGMTLLGVAVVRSGVWSSWRRVAVLACGVAIFIVVLPGVVGGFVALRLALTLWNVLWAFLGIALVIHQPIKSKSPNEKTVSTGRVSGRRDRD